MFKFRYWLSSELIAAGINIIPDMHVKMIMLNHLEAAADELIGEHTE